MVELAAVVVPHVRIQPASKVKVQIFLNVLILEQASQLQRQEALLREQADRLQALRSFDRESEIAGGVFISYSHDDGDVVESLTRRFD